MQAGQGDSKRATGRQRHAAAAVPPGAAGLQALQGLPDDALARLADAVVVRLVGGPPPAVDQLLHRLADMVAERVRQPLADLVVALNAQQPAAPVDLAQLLRGVWQRYRDDVWTVRDLRALGLVDAAETHRTGRRLSELCRKRIGVDDLQLRRVSTGDRAGVVWQLVGGGDGPSPPQGPPDTIEAVQATWSRHDRHYPPP